MTEIDFRTLGIVNFTQAEVIATGADLKDVVAMTMVRLQRMRNLLNHPIGLLKNGLTTGEHLSDEHGQGLAVDYFLHAGVEVKCENIMRVSLMVGFWGFGCYYNNETGFYSFHGDSRPVPGFWGGSKQDTESAWLYYQLLVDPKVYINQLKRKGH